MLMETAHHFIYLGNKIASDGESYKDTISRITQDKSLLKKKKEKNFSLQTQ